MPPNEKVADLSHWQPSPDWAAAAAGLGGVMLKATDGASWTDPAFIPRAQAARAAGIPVGAYHFFRPLEPAADQAAWFLAVCRRAGFPLALALDLEPLKSDIHRTEDWALLDAVKAELAVLGFLANMGAAVDGPVGVYTTDFFMRTFLPRTDLSAQWLWVADYRPGAAEPVVPSCWAGKWTMWQTTPHGRAAGIAGDVDLDTLAPGVSFRQLLRMPR